MWLYPNNNETIRSHANINLTVRKTREVGSNSEAFGLSPPSSTYASSPGRGHSTPRCGSHYQRSPKVTGTKVRSLPRVVNIR